MRLHRFIIISSCALLPFFGAAVMWGVRLALWPLCIFAAVFQRDPSGLVLVFMLLATAAFWGFIIELIYRKVKVVA